MEVDSREAVTRAARDAYRLEERAEVSGEVEEDSVREVCTRIGKAGAALAKGKTRKLAFYVWYARECAGALAAAARACAGTSCAPVVCVAVIDAASSICNAWKDIDIDEADPRVIVCAAAAGVAAACSGSGGADANAEDEEAARRAIRGLLIDEICSQSEREREALFNLVVPHTTCDANSQRVQQQEEEEEEEEEEEDEDEIRLKSVLLLGGGLALFLLLRDEQRIALPTLANNPMCIQPLLDRFLVHGVTSGPLQMDSRSEDARRRVNTTTTANHKETATMAAMVMTMTTRTTTNAVTVFSTLLHGMLRPFARLRIIEAMLVRAEESVPPFFRNAVAALLLSNVTRAVSDDDDANPAPSECAVRIVVFSLAPICGERDVDRDALIGLVHTHADRLIGTFHLAFLLLLDSSARLCLPCTIPLSVCV